MTLAGRDSGDLSMTFRDLKSFGARLSDLSRTLAGDPETSVSDLKFKTLNDKLPVLAQHWLVEPGTVYGVATCMCKHHGIHRSV